MWYQTGKAIAENAIAIAIAILLILSLITTHHVMGLRAVSFVTAVAGIIVSMTTVVWIIFKSRGE